LGNSFEFPFGKLSDPGAGACGWELPLGRSEIRVNVFSI